MWEYNNKTSIMPRSLPTNVLISKVFLLLHLVMSMACFSASEDALHEEAVVTHSCSASPLRSAGFGMYPYFVTIFINVRTVGI